MRTLVIIMLVVSGCASAPHKGASAPENKPESTERYIKVCAFNLLVGVMLLPTKGINAFKELCEENEQTKGVTL